MSKIDNANNPQKPNDLISIKGYTIQERIGIGSYGRVYKVLKDNKIYVLKEIPLNMGNLNSPKPDKLTTVQNEADILSSLNNKYIVKFYESFKQNQNIYIVMEYCEGGDLCTFMRECKKKRKNEEYFLDEDFVWKIFIQISIGLYYIHSKKILHRDIKTLNIFLTNNFDGKIGDLGVAKVLEDTNHAMTFVGTPYYVSPEMCKNRPYNEKSDIWALGCILYEMLTFRHPFTASNQAALFIKILNGNYTPLPPDTPNDLKYMVEFILQKNENKRPTMKEIITKNIFQYNAERLGLGEDLKEVLDVKVLSYNMEKNSILNYNLNSKNWIDNLWSSRENINNYVTNSVINMKCRLGKSPEMGKKNNIKQNLKNSNININNGIMKNKTKAILKTPKNTNKCQLAEFYNKKVPNKILKNSVNNEIKNNNEIEKLEKENNENNNNNNPKNIKKRKIVHKSNNRFKSHKLNSNEKNIIDTNDLFAKIAIKNPILNNSNSPRKSRPYEISNFNNNNNSNNCLNHNSKQKPKQITIDSKDGSVNNNNTNTQKSNKENSCNENSNKIKNNLNNNNIINNAKTSTNNCKILNNNNIKNKKIKEIIKTTNTNSNSNLNNINLSNDINNRGNIKPNSGDNHRSKNLKRIIEKEKLSLEKQENITDKNKNNNNNNTSSSSNSDIIKESDFITALNNTIKNYPLIITLSDLYNHQFNAEDTKNMNTTSATTALGKVDMPTISVEEINEECINDFNKNNLIKIREETKEDTVEIINNSCDEFTQTEMIKRTETFLNKKIPNFNYEEKIKKNKIEIKNIIEMPKDELMKTSEIYKVKYDYYLDKINQYKNIIDIKAIRKYYANVGNATDQQINAIFNKIVQHINQRLPSKKAEELSDIIYNLICFEIKYKIAQKTIKMKW